jgi:signal transduction histidine kinase/ligand-binding sensor domain-containing protein
VSRFPCKPHGEHNININYQTILLYKMKSTENFLVYLGNNFFQANSVTFLTLSSSINVIKLGIFSHVIAVYKHHSPPGFVNIQLKTIFSALLLLILIFSVVIPAYSQEGDPPAPAREQVRFDHLTVEDGLSSDSVVTILQDDQGFMWFGTFDGLNRYDGYEFKVYRNNPQDPNSLSANLVVDIIQDQDRFIWVGTSGGGLNRYNPRTEQFTHYIYDPVNPNSLSSNTVYTILQDSQGVLWVGTDGGGLNRYDPNIDGFIRYQNDPSDPQSLSDNIVQSIFEDSQGTLWVGTDTGGLNRFNQQTGKFKIFRHDPEDSTSLAHNKVTDIYQDQDGLMWIGTRDGLDRLDPETGVFSHYKTDLDDPYSLSHNFVSDIIEDYDSNLWISTTGGLNYFDYQHQHFVRYLADQNDPDGLNHNSIRKLYNDNTGLLWVATIGGGVNKLDLQAKPFTQVCDSNSTSFIPDINDVLAVYRDPNATLWIGTSGGLISIDCLSGIVNHYTHTLGGYQGLSNNMVRAIARDNNGLVWLGTQGGLNRFDPRTQEFSVYRSDPSDPDGLLSDAVWSVYLDSKGILWVGSALGLNRFDPRTEQFTAAYQPNPDDPNSLSGSTVTVISEDQDAVLWIGTLGDGLNRFDPSAERFTVFRHHLDDVQSLRDNTIYTILVDSNKRVWVGTGAGLDRFDPNGNNFEHFGESQGLPDLNIVGILEDNLSVNQGDPNLWISTSSGLFKFNPETENVKKYDGGIRFERINYNRNATYKDVAGKLYFGSTKGLTAFYPSQIIDNKHIPPVVITDFQLAGKSVEISEDSILKQAIQETDHLVLSYRDRVISFGFSALSYRAPARNHYRYMLEGFDEGWTEVGSDRRFVTYTNLNPGEYTLRVLGSNNDGVWNEEGASIAITITPPWWETIWFRGGLILLVVAGVFSAYRWRVSSLEKRSRQLEAQIAERTKEVATLLAVSQEVNSTLNLESLLSLILDELKKVVDYDVATVHRLVDENMELMAHRWLFPQEGQPSQHLPAADIPIIQEMVHSRRVILIGDHQFDPEIIGDTVLYRHDLTGEVLQASRTLMSVPLIVKDEIIGMLVLGHHQPNHWSEMEKELVQAFANQAAVAIANAELFEEVEEAATIEERSRLARELHDSATQSLYSATLLNEAGKELAEQGDLESASYYLSRVGEVIYQALKDMRLLVFQLRPPILEKEGLVMALQHRLDAVEKRAGMDARLISDPVPHLSDQVSQELYSITIEALNNTLKHAQAEKVRITIRSDNGNVDLEVHDDGRGFDTETAYNSGGMGLTNMAERASKLDTDLTIDSGHDQGTNVRVSVPLPDSPSKSPKYSENGE